MSETTNRAIKGPNKTATTRVWTYAHSADDPGTIELQWQMLAVAAIGMVVAGRSRDLGSQDDGNSWPGWDQAVAAVAAGDADGVAVADLDRLGRDPSAVAQRIAAVTGAGGQVWIIESTRLHPVDASKAITEFIATARERQGRA